MPRKLLFSVIFVIGFVSCKTNQMVNHNRVGKWITVDTLDEIYTIKGRYSKGNELGTWKHYRKGILVKKEKYHLNTSRLTFYYPNGKIMKRGRTQLDQTEKEDHWYYIGDWYFYNEMGQLDTVKTYKKEEYKK